MNKASNPTIPFAERLSRQKHISRTATGIFELHRVLENSDDSQYLARVIEHPWKYLLVAFSGTLHPSNITHCGLSYF